MSGHSSMRTPLGRVRGLGSAHEGTIHFWRQRLTAVIGLPLVLFTIGLFISLAGADHAEVVETLSHPLVAVLLIALSVTLAVHMRIGMQVIIEDYVHSEGLKILSLIANTAFSALVGLTAVFALLKIAFGG